MSDLTDRRIEQLCAGKPQHKGSFVVYWAQANRRAEQNLGLNLAINRANTLRLPLLVYEAIRVDYPFASDRFHAFVLQGAKHEAKEYAKRGARYAFFLPRDQQSAAKVLTELSKQAHEIVTDSSPSFIFSAQTKKLAAKAHCPIYAVDDNCVCPLSLFSKEEYMARTIRPKIVKALPDWLKPLDEPKAEYSWNKESLQFDAEDIEHLDIASTLQQLPIDHSVTPVQLFHGGSHYAQRRLNAFVANSLAHYPENHNHPDLHGTSGLSAYVHFGMLSARQIALAVRDSSAPQAARDAFIEQLLVRRTLAFNFAYTNPQHRTYDAIPNWAQQSLLKHQSDPRPKLLSRSDLEQANTPDPVWNAAQRELLATGIIQNYVRMLWGKTVLFWKKTPQEAFDDLVYLNDKYALDGRDPNTYMNIAWIFGKHDRAWGPERPIFGIVRYMSTELAPKKIKMKNYLAKYSTRTQAQRT